MSISNEPAFETLLSYCASNAITEAGTLPSVHHVFSYEADWGVGSEGSRCNMAFVELVIAFLLLWRLNNVRHACI